MLIAFNMFGQHVEGLVRYTGRPEGSAARARTRTL